MKLQKCNKQVLDRSQVGHGGAKQTSSCGKDEKHSMLRFVGIAGAHQQDELGRITRFFVAVYHDRYTNFIFYHFISLNALEICSSDDDLKVSGAKNRRLDSRRLNFNIAREEWLPREWLAR